MYFKLINVDFNNRRIIGYLTQIFNGMLES